MHMALTYLLLAGGIVLQVMNINVYASFLRRASRDVLSSGSLRDQRLSYAALILLLFFLAGYILVTLSGRASLLIGAIFFFGAVFCTIMIHLVTGLTSTVKHRSVDIVKTLTKVIEERDPNLNGHSLFVQNVSMCIWRHLPYEMRRSINEVDLNYAALLHDVGKLGIPESVLNKPGKLNEQEWELMRRHPRKGVEILHELQSFETILPWIEYHHERMDGKGYYGLPGDQIPLESRIIAVADTYSAIMMRRSYKPARTYAEAIAIMKDVSGTQLDAGIVEIFCRIPKEELEKCAPQSVETGSAG